MPAPVEHGDDFNTIREHPIIHEVRESPKFASSHVS
jgi:hypothetical protein